MAYAGIQTMLLAYKMRKSDKEFEATQIAQQLYNATKDSSALSEWRDQELGKLSEDDPNYDAQVDKVENQYNTDLKDIAAWEDDLEQQKSNCETEIKQLDGYISSWEQALQTNIQKAHTYGAQ
ncbi:MAG: hypothetical protein DKM24_04840 [Candidatus Melainabacteria bacterium]|nr:MAG: hypothetical protein DKM24_04840 [Candidatus Melainabacteria bacterium]